MAVWDDNVAIGSDPPPWLLTGHMLLWSDGSPAHIDMEPFKGMHEGWESHLMISRSTMSGTRWLTMKIKLSPAVRKDWEAHGKSARARALQALAVYLKLTEWH